MLLPNATFRGIELNLDLCDRFTQRADLLLIGATAAADEHDVGDHVADWLKLRLEQARDWRCGALNLLPVRRQRLTVSLRLRHALDDGIQSLYLRDRVLQSREFGQSGAVDF